MIHEVTTVLGIAVICYLIGLGVKISPLDDKFIPLIVGVCGGALGALGMITMPEYPASNVIDAVAVGIASGLAATGTDQVFKELRGTSTYQGKHAPEGDDSADNFTV